MPKAQQWMSGTGVMKRWGIDWVELVELLRQGLPAYDRQEGGFLEKVDADRLDDYDPHFMLFKPADVEAFEHENEWLLVSAAQQVEQSLASNLTDKEKRRLGQLLREKVKWDKSLEAAVHIGLFCAQLNHHITRAELEDEIYKIDPDLPNTTVDRIWRAIPEQHRKAAGRPKKK